MDLSVNDGYCLVVIDEVAVHLALDNVDPYVVVEFSVGLDLDV